MRIAVIGSGVAGLTAARLLDRRHDVVLYEASDRIGGHTCTVPVKVNGRPYAIDIGFIVFNDRTYPNFTKLLDSLDVAALDTDMSFSLSCEATGLEYDAGTLSGLFAQRRNLLRPGFYRMWADALRFYREAPTLLREADPKLTLGAYLASRRFGSDFVERHLLPMGAAIWSTDTRRMRDFPVVSLIRFFANHGLLSVGDRPQWKVVHGGSVRYVERILEDFGGEVREGCPVAGVRRTPRAIHVTTRDGASDAFDEVVIAAHSNQALVMLEKPTAAERAVLGNIAYQPNTLVLHTDERAMPASRRAWASWNYRLAADPDAPVSLTYHMNRLQRLDAPVEFCATLNPTIEIPPDRVLHAVRFDHPVFDAAALVAQRERSAICGVDRIHFCGAYWGYGFHEDGVKSALDVARRFGEEI